jgi:hypothetical protein
VLDDNFVGLKIVIDSKLIVAFHHPNRGVIFDGKELNYVEPQSGSSLDDEHILMKHSDLTANFSCGKFSNFI